MDVHTHDNLRRTEFTEGMLDAVGDIGSQAHLCLHVNIAGTGTLFQMFQQPESFFTVDIGVCVVIHYIQGHDTAFQLLVAHQDSQLQQLWGNVRILHTKHDFLIIL